MADEINHSRADVVWVGIGVPKQEKWMAQMRPMLETPVLVGVGAAFDFHAGLVPQAPPWMQQAGLEWAYRLTREPRRLWRRYLRYNPRFVGAFALQLTRSARPAASGKRSAQRHNPSVSATRSSSIVIPTRGRPEYLDVTLASVMPQAARARRRGDRRQPTAPTPRPRSVADAHGATLDLARSAKRRQRRTQRRGRRLRPAT